MVAADDAIADPQPHMRSHVDEVVFHRDMDFSGREVPEAKLPEVKPVRGEMRSSVDEVLYGRDLDNSAGRAQDLSFVRSTGQTASDQGGANDSTRPRGHTPPPQPAPEGQRAGGARTRSELLQQRKQDYILANEERKRAHEENNPVWAATLEETLGSPRPSYNRTRTELLADRRRDMVSQAVASSGDGVLDADKAIMLNSDPTKLVTTLSRPAAYGEELPAGFVDEPAVPTRSRLNQLRAEELRALNAQTMRSIGERGYRSFYQRASDRLDSSLKAYYDSQDGGGEKATRSQLLLQRRRNFIDENERFLERHRSSALQEPKFADQALPFWTVPGPLPEPTLTSQIDLRAAQQWYRKPEMFVPGREPREADPFKALERVRLEDKLSSGPKKHQRGYLSDERDVAGNISRMPAPPPEALTKAEDRRASTRETLRFLDFKLRADRFARDYSTMDAGGASLESQFAAGRPLPGRRTSTKPSTRPPVAESSATATTFHSPVLVTTRRPSIPGTTPSVRNGGFQAIDAMLRTLAS